MHNPGVDGYVLMRTKSRLIKLKADDVRRLYYAVLGIKMLDGSLKEYVNAPVSNPQGLTVDVPEDVLRVERYLTNSR